MKVLLLTSEPFPNGMAATNRIRCYAKAILGAGIDCKVLVFRRTEPYGKDLRNSLKEGIDEGIPFEYIGGTPLRSSNLVIRKFHDFSDFIQTCVALLKYLGKGDVLFLYSGGFIYKILLFMKVAHIKGAFCVRDLCEYPYVYENDDISRSHIVFTRQFSALDGVISISEPLMSLAKQYTKKSCKHIKIPILVDYEKYRMDNVCAESSVKYIFHSGVLSDQKDGILGMIEAFAKARARLGFPICFFTAGTLEKSPQAKEIDALIRQYGVSDYVIFLGNLSSQEVKKYLAAASLVISNKHPNRQNQCGFSTKLGEYSAAEKPIIITKVGEPLNYFNDRESAIFVSPDDIYELADAIVWVFEHYDESRRIAKNGQSICRECFDYRNWINELGSFFYTL